MHFPLCTLYLSRTLTHTSNDPQSIGRYSKYCNRTIEHGVDPTPLFRRWLSTTKASVEYHTLVISPISFTTAVVCTTAGVLLGMVFSRPRSQPFRPLISNVRMEALSWLYDCKDKKKSSEAYVAVETIRLLEAEVEEDDKDFVGTGALAENVSKKRLRWLMQDNEAWQISERRSDIQIPGFVEGDFAVSNMPIDAKDGLDEVSIIDGIEEDDGQSAASSDDSNDMLPSVRLAQDQPRSPQRVRFTDEVLKTSSITGRSRSPISYPSGLELEVWHPKPTLSSSRSSQWRARLRSVRVAIVGEPRTR